MKFWVFQIWNAFFRYLHGAPISASSAYSWARKRISSITYYLKRTSLSILFVDFYLSLRCKEYNSDKYFVIYIFYVYFQERWFPSYATQLRKCRNKAIFQAKLLQFSILAASSHSSKIINERLTYQVLRTLFYIEFHGHQFFLKFSIKLEH